MKTCRKGIFSTVILILFLAGAIQSKAQFYDEYPYPQDRYINPLGIDWKLSGTFGEPRGNHFHAGSDIKTNGATGYKLYSIADGYIARIKVSPYGYGKALYIAHYDGFTSVYAHMSEFNDRIDSLVKSHQYAEQSFEQDIYLDYDKVKVKQGDIIGLSGNSGGSAGPHLHFEIRETSTQKPLNPLFFGYEVKDTRKPQLMGVKVTSMPSDYYDVLGSKSEMYMPAAKVNDTVDVQAGKVGVGVHSLDKQDMAENRNGVFRVEMYVDGESHFQATMDQLDFSQGRYVNAFRDFYERKNSKTVYNCYRLPGNRLEVYEYLVNDGFIELEEGEVHDVRIDVWDFHKNKSTVSFVIRGVAPIAAKVKDDASLGVKIFEVKHDENFNYNTGDFRIHIPSGTFYDNIDLNYKRKEGKGEGVYSDVHQVHDYLVPMHKSAIVQVSAIGIPKPHSSKAVMVHKDLKGIEQSLTTFWKDGMVSARSREVGYFYVKIDTIAPEIQWLNFIGKTKSFRGSQIRVHIHDQLAGIKTYNGYIDDQWVVFDYDAKRDLLTYNFDDRCQKGEHTLKIIVTDKVGNKAEKSIKFIAP